MTEEYEYGNKFRRVILYGLGGRWVFAMAVCTDTAGTDKIRVAKGKVTHRKAPPKGEVQELDGEFAHLPMTQPNKLNIKRRSEWEIITAGVEALLPELGDANEEAD